MCYMCCGSAGRQRLIRKPAAQVFDEARPLIVSGDNDKGLEPDPDEPDDDEVEFPARISDADKTSTRSRFRPHSRRGGLGRLAAWHLPGGPVGPPARWAATTNVEVRQSTWAYPANKKR